MTESRLNNYTICVNTVIVWSLWLAGLTLVVLRLALNLDDLGPVGIALIALGHFRGVAGMLHHLESRERNAFELGRDSVWSTFHPESSV